MDSARSGPRSGRSDVPRRIVVPVISLTLAATAAACTDGVGNDTGRPSATIPQPAVSGLEVAPSDARVDVARPSFSDPTRVTNPLFPVSRQASVLMLGRVDDQPFRTEVTLLPETRIIEWNGQQIETLVSQYTAYLGGRIHEVAYDFYAQADDGSVWYFGEDVFNFADGAIVDTHGTWIAGKDGPPAMIMPADPRVGDVYRPENIPGFVFEEVTVRDVGRSLDGPLGTVDGGLVIRELHMDGSTEAKMFAPGYGEFFTGAGGDVEALALAVPTDAEAGPVPRALTSLVSRADAIFEQVASRDWTAAASTARAIDAAWTSYTATDLVPPMIERTMARSVTTLSRSLDAREASATRQAAIDVAQSALDLQLRYRPVDEVDVERFRLWTRQLQLDASAGDTRSVNGDLFTLDYIRDRIGDALASERLARVNALLEELQVALDEGDLRAASSLAGELGSQAALAASR